MFFEYLSHLNLEKRVVSSFEYLLHLNLIKRRVSSITFHGNMVKYFVNYVYNSFFVAKPIKKIE